MEERVWSVANGSPYGASSARVIGMRVAEGRVVRGAIRTLTRFPEGARVTLIQHDDRPPVSVDPDDEASILQGIAEVEDSKGVAWSRLRQRLRRR